MSKDKEKSYFNWLKYQKLYFALSALVIGIGIFSMINWGLKLGLDFTGGASVEYSLGEKSGDEVKTKFEELVAPVGQVVSSGENGIIIKTENLNSDQEQKTIEVADSLQITRNQIQNVGPSVGPELVKKTIIAIIIAAFAILSWVAISFKKVIFGVSAILATLHDTLVLVGLFSLFGKIFGAEVDFLFVTAVLTTLSFSVHDTIVVFDRIREIQKKHGGELKDVINRAISETMRRSIINSVTIIIMLLALVVFGGETIRWFAVALLVGAISGTYSSPFVAVPLYFVLSRFQKKK
jgi:preprotein translocase subunit SecF